MSEQVHDITSVPEQPIPVKPEPTADLERDADLAINYLDRLIANRLLDSDLRMALNEIKGTVKDLKRTVNRQSQEAQLTHERLVDVIKNQRHH